jgi:hypothetical protein
MCALDCIAHRRALQHDPLVRPSNVLSASDGLGPHVCLRRTWCRGEWLPRTSALGMRDGRWKMGRPRQPASSVPSSPIRLTIGLKWRTSSRCRPLFLAPHVDLVCTFLVLGLSRRHQPPRHSHTSNTRALLSHMLLFARRCICALPISKFD